MEVSATPQFKRNEGQDGGDEKATNERRDGEPPSKREEEEEEASSSVKKDHKKYRRDKPWDTAEINHWKEVDMKSIEGTRAFSEESSFATLFPQYREKYLREVWKVVTNALDKHGIACELNLIEGSMTVRTTRKTRDPVIIFYARDLIKLLSRSVPVSQALKILNDDMLCDIVKINGYCGRNKEKFIKRRDRLIGPKGSTLKALELLTECYILVQGNTVCCMGKYIGLRWARNVIEDCMLNVHPVYNIKILMIKRELVKDPVLKDEMWDRFLPKFKKTNSNTNKKKKKKVKKEKKKEYQAFPPLPQPSKVDLQLESGEYFMSEDAKRKEKASKQMEQRELVSKERQVQKDKVFQPPTNKGSDKKRPRDEHDNDNDNDNNNNNGEDVMKMAERVKKKAKKARKKQQKK